MKKIRLTISIFLVSLFAILTQAAANIASINAAIIDDQQTITVFFEKAETFKADNIQKQFSIQYAYEYVNDNERRPVDSGKWHISKDGLMLSYYPVPKGVFTVKADQYHNSQDQAFEVYIGETSQAANIVGRGPVLPVMQGNLPIETIGTREVDIEFFAIDNPPLLFENYYIGSSFTNWGLQTLTQDMTPAGIFRYVLPKDIPTHIKSEHRIPIDKNIKPGAYIVMINPAGQIDKTLDTRIVFISDIGVHVRRYENKTLIIANHFSSSQPVDNKTTLEIWKNNRRKLEVTKNLCTFEEGLCLINRALTNDETVVVRKGEDFSLLPMREYALDLNDFAITGDRYQTQVAHVYSNRQLYRPGEEIVINVLLRDDDGQMLPAQRPELKLINPEGKSVLTLPLQAQAEGLYQANIATEPDAKTGNWRVEIRTDKHLKYPNGTMTLHIEEFMPERMELQLKPSGDQIIASDFLSVAAESRYLFGAQASFNIANTEINLNNIRTPFIKHPDWFVGTLEFNYQHIKNRFVKIPGALDEQGHTSILFTLPVKKEIPEVLSQITRAHGTVTVMDGKATGISRDFQTDFWPVTHVPVIRPLFGDVLSYGDKAEFELFSVTPEGKYTNRSLKLTLKYKSRWCTWVYSEQNGWDCHRNYDYEIHELKTIQTGTKPVRYMMDPNSWGDYVLVLTDLDTGFTTEYQFTSSWSSSNTGQLPVAKPMSLNLTTNKPVYKTGEDLELTIDAPFNGYLTLLVEGDELLYNHGFEVDKGKSGIAIRLHPKWKRHDLYLTGLLLAKNNDGETVRALGVIPIKLNRSDRKVNAALSFNEVTLPEQPYQVTIKVPDVKPGEQLYATVSITDQGILNMTPTKPQNIFDTFYKQKRYGVDIVDYYNRLFKNSRKAMLTPKFGGDGDTGSADADINLTEMKTVSLTSTLIPLNEKGEATVDFMLPEFNGEAKVVAKVFSSTRVGETEKQVTIRAPIVADLVTPKFIRVHDETFVSLSLHNLSGTDTEIMLTLTSKEFDADFTEKLSLKDKSSLNRLIPVKLSSFHPRAELQLDVDSKVYQVTRSYRIGTIPFNPKTSELNRSYLEKNQLWKRDSYLSENYDQNYQERLLVSRLPILNVLSYTENLFGYPYGCTEQTTSRAFPWLFKSHPVLDYEKKQAYERDQENLSNQSTRLSYSAWEEKLIRSAISRILNRQVYDGGFTLWSSSDSHPAISAYVTDFLYQAAKKYPQLVSLESLDKSSDYLKKYLVSINKSLNEQKHVRNEILNDVSYAAWILAREGKIFSADLTLLSAKSDQLSPLSRVYLAAANFVAGNELVGKQLITDLPFVSWQNRYGYFATSITEISLAIDLFNQLSVKGLYRAPVSQIQSMHQLLNEKLSDRTYLSTQERYALIKIGIDVPEDPTPITAQINGKEQKITSNQAIDANTIAQFKTTEPVFIEYQIEGYPKQIRSNSTFDVAATREYYNVPTDEAGNYTVNVGDRILVVTTINPSRRLPNALLVDGIPGGFNLINPNLLDTDINSFYQSFKPVKLTHPLIHQEFRFDQYLAAVDMTANKAHVFAYVIEAQIPGEYRIPSLLLEDMYLPTLRSITAFDQKIIIK